MTKDIRAALVQRAEAVRKMPSLAAYEVLVGDLLVMMDAIPADAVTVDALARRVDDLIGELQAAAFDDADMQTREWERWFATERKAIAEAFNAAAVPVDAERLARAIHSLKFDRGDTPTCPICTDVAERILAADAALAPAPSELKVRALYSRLAKEYEETEPIVPDHGGGVPGDLYDLTTQNNCPRCMHTSDFCGTDTCNCELA